MSSFIAERARQALRGLIAALAVTCFVTPAAAQVETSTCLAIAGSVPKLWRAQAGPENDEVRITYVGHSAFRIQTPAGISIVTDFAGNYGEGGVPAVVTMNHAHSSHFTQFPDPAIAHVLRGWDPSGEGPAEHHLRLEDVYIRNVPTDLYYNGALIEEDGNSIFIFEVAGLCIGHLGHLHHRLTPDHVAQIGRLDILFMPVDGTYTMSQASMIELAQQLRSSMVIPMHFFSTFSLQRFLSGMEPDFGIAIVDGNTITISLRTLPQSPVVTVLSPY